MTERECIFKPGEFMHTQLRLLYNYNCALCLSGLKIVKKKKKSSAILLTNTFFRKKKHLVMESKHLHLGVVTSEPKSHTAHLSENNGRAQRPTVARDSSERNLKCQPGEGCSYLAETLKAFTTAHYTHSTTGSTALWGVVGG